MADIKQGDNPILDYKAMVAKNQAESASTALQIHSLMDQQTAASDQEMIETLSLGEAKATIATSRNALQAATDAKSAEIRVRMGADPTLQGSLSSQWLDRMNENAQKAYDTLDVIKDKQSKTLLNDPLGFIQAQFTLPSDIATHNYYAQRSNMAEEQLNQITSASNANVIAASNASAKTSTEIAIAEANEARLTASIGYDKLLRSKAGDYITGLNDLAGLSQRDLGNVFQAHAAANSDAQLAETKKLHEDNMKMRQEAIDAKIEGKQNLTATMEEYNAGARRANKPVYSDVMAFARYYNNNNRNPDFQNTWGMGQEIIARGGATNGVAVAGSAGDAALLYASGSTNGLKNDPVAAFLVDKYNEKRVEPNAPKDRGAMAAVVTAYARGEAVKQLNDIRPDKGNIYAAPPPSVVLTNAATSGPFIDAEIRPLIKSAETQISEETMLGAAYAYAKKNGKNGITAAAQDIAAYYRAAALSNTLTHQYDEKGLPKQTSYNARINGAIVDLTDPLAVTRNIMLHTMSAGAARFGGTQLRTSLGGAGSLAGNKELGN